MCLDFKSKVRGNYIDLGILHTKLVTKAMFPGKSVQGLMYTKKAVRTEHGEHGSS